MTNLHIILDLAKKLRDKNDYQSPEEVNLDITQIIISCENEIKEREARYGS